MSKHHVIGYFGDFEQAFAAIADIRANKIPGLSVDDITLKSPIEHPEIEEVLGERPSQVPKFTLMGAVFGLTFCFLMLASAQATFLVQPQGGKPVIPLPSNFVLCYEMLILFGVLFTIASFLIGGRMLRRRASFYNEKVSLDQVGVLLELDEKNVQALKSLFQQHKVLDIREEVVR
jgi:Alternative complex III, ActD subunit